MNKAIIGVVAGMCGAVIGAAGSYVYLNKKFEKQLDKEVEALKALYCTPKTKVEPEEPNKEAKEETKEETNEESKDEPKITKDYKTYIEKLNETDYIPEDTKVTYSGMINTDIEGSHLDPNRDAEEIKKKHGTVINIDEKGEAIVRHANPDEMYKEDGYEKIEDGITFFDEECGNYRVYDELSIDEIPEADLSDMERLEWLQSNDTLYDDQGCVFDDSAARFPVNWRKHFTEEDNVIYMYLIDWQIWYEITVC